MSTKASQPFSQNSCFVFDAFIIWTFSIGIVNKSIAKKLWLAVLI